MATHSNAGITRMCRRPGERSKRNSAPNLNDADVSTAPPKIPDSGFSPVRLQGQYVRRGLPVDCEFFTSRGLRPPFVRIAASVLSSFCVEGRGALVHHCSSGQCRFTPGTLAPVRVMLSRTICDLQS